MSEQPVWPPPPSLPDLSAAHDGFLTACLRAPATKPPISRLRLCMNLRKETGLPLHQCRVFVNSYCDRNTILTPARGLVLWLVGLLTLGPLIAAFAIYMTYFSFERSLDRSTPQATIHALRAGRIYLELVCIGIDAVFFCVLLIFLVLRAWQTRREAADARKKMSGSNFATPK